MIVLYTTKTCPKCGIVKAKLENKKIEYTSINDESVLEEKGYDLLPVLSLSFWKTIPTASFALQVMR